MKNLIISLMAWYITINAGIWAVQLTPGVKFFMFIFIILCTFSIDWWLEERWNAWTKHKGL